jgi:hypothetical protein
MITDSLEAGFRTSSSLIGASSLESYGVGCWVICFAELIRAAGTSARASCCIHVPCGRARLWKPAASLPRFEVAALHQSKPHQSGTKQAHCSATPSKDCVRVLDRRSLTAESACLCDLANSRECSDRGEECRGGHGGVSGEAARTGAARTELPARLGEGICKMHRNRIIELSTAERLVRWLGVKDLNGCCHSS